MWPAVDDPSFGVFVSEQVDSLRRRGVLATVHVIEGRRRLNYFRSVPLLRHRLSCESFDVVHAHYVLTGLVTWTARLGLGGPPLVVTNHGVEVFAGWQAPLARFVTARADRSLVISRAMADRLGLGEHCVVPCGLDLELFRPGSREEARAALGLDQDAVIIAWVGADRPEKRLDLARQALAALKNDVTLASLHVVHDRPHTEVPLHLQAADALLVTSRWEGGPLVAKEALACNLPVVSSDVGDVADLVGGLAGCFIVPAEPRAMAEALRQAVSVGRTDGREVVRPFSLDRIATRLIEIYRELASRRPTPL